jgi:tetratricopeptide (TPR) repeat protein
MELVSARSVLERALKIDEKALGHDHPEVAMDLSNLGIAYRALGRPDIATGLFERAHKLMLAAVGPDDPKTQAILRNLG